jgi:hypothetical protein
MFLGNYYIPNVSLKVIWSLIWLVLNGWRWVLAFSLASHHNTSYQYKKVTFLFAGKTKFTNFKRPWNTNHLKITYYVLNKRDCLTNNAVNNGTRDECIHSWIIGGFWYDHISKQIRKHKGTCQKYSKAEAKQKVKSDIENHK